MPSDYFTRKNTLLLIYIILHVLIVIYWGFYWNLDWNTGEDQTVFNVVRYYMQPLGLWQNWNVFAPPPQIETHILIQGVSNGFLANYTPSYQTNPTKIHEEDMRKWHENIVQNRFSAYRTTYLEYRCREFEKQYDSDFSEVTLYIYHRPIPRLDSNVRERKKFIRKVVVEC